MFSKRIQVLIEKEKYARLKNLGKKAHKSLGEIFREAVKLYGERLASKAARLQIVENMAKLKVPAADWPNMEKGILKARSK